MLILFAIRATKSAGLGLTHYFQQSRLHERPHDAKETPALPRLHRGPFPGRKAGAFIPVSPLLSRAAMSDEAKCDSRLDIPMNQNDRDKLAALAVACNFKSTSEYARYVLLEHADGAVSMLRRLARFRNSDDGRNEG
jgi:hypothetical protein